MITYRATEDGQPLTEAEQDRLDYLIRADLDWGLDCPRWMEMADLIERDKAASLRAVLAEIDNQKDQTNG